MQIGLVAKVAIDLLHRGGQHLLRAASLAAGAPRRVLFDEHGQQQVLDAFGAQLLHLCLVRLQTMPTTPAATTSASAAPTAAPGGGAARTCPSGTASRRAVPAAAGIEVSLHVIGQRQHRGVALRRQLAQRLSSPSCPDPRAALAQAPRRRRSVVRDPLRRRRGGIGPLAPEPARAARRRRFGSSTSRSICAALAPAAPVGRAPLRSAYSSTPSE